MTMAASKKKPHRANMTWVSTADDRSGNNGGHSPCYGTIVGEQVRLIITDKKGHMVELDNEDIESLGLTKMMNGHN